VRYFSDVDRRALLISIAASAVLSLSACVEHGIPGHTHSPTPLPTFGSVVPSPTPVVHPTPFPIPALNKVRIPGGAIYGLPVADGNVMAWTVDDGADTNVVAAYAEIARVSGIRLTFFLNGKYPSWTDNASALRPLVESGQVQLGNHTFDHLALTQISDAAIVDQLQRNATFVRNTYGVDAAPFYRPPYGYTNAHTQAVAASIGYRAPVLWYGTLSDSGLITPAQVVQFAQAWFLPHHIVIGHANFPPVTTVYSQLLAILRQRSLQTVTLNDVFSY
jgi:peptidoglycan/xylan/chitin deacetylase (PgdA/CDA1 family)